MRITPGKPFLGFTGHRMAGRVPHRIGDLVGCVVWETSTGDRYADWSQSRADHFSQPVWWRDGKLISPQSIAVACAATGLIGRETDIFRKTLKYSVMLLALAIAVVLLQAYVIPSVVPQDIVAAVLPTDMRNSPPRQVAWLGNFP